MLKISPAESAAVDTVDTYYVRLMVRKANKENETEANRRIMEGTGAGKSISVSFETDKLFTAC